jgi:hypothetical protein
VNRRLIFTPEAEATLNRLELSDSGLHTQVKKILGYMETNLRHRSLQTHEFSSMKGPNGEKVFQAYAQNRTPGAHRVFFCYGPDIKEGRKRIPVLTILAIVKHPD